MLAGERGLFEFSVVSNDLKHISDIYFKNWWLVVGTTEQVRFADINCLAGCLCQRQFQLQL